MFMFDYVCNRSLFFVLFSNPKFSEPVMSSYNNVTSYISHTWIRPMKNSLTSKQKKMKSVVKKYVMKTRLCMLDPKCKSHIKKLEVKMEIFVENTNI